MKLQNDLFGYVLVVCCLLLGGIVLLGCGRGLGDVPLEGRITFEGKAVPGGAIQFVPDSDKGNEGTGTSAVIENGRYKTNAKRGVFGGPYVVTVYATDGTTPEDIDTDTSLFDPYVIHVDIPHEGGGFDIAIPQENGEYIKFNKISL
ncbi:MAG: hypothetical protein Q4G68_09180 [Planctomycetia bacterium]|nr:hypothetical protein [Planctomycetia bacterium]